MTEQQSINQFIELILRISDLGYAPAKVINSVGHDKTGEKSDQ